MTNEKNGRCSGHCCKGFQIGGMNIEELRFEYENWLRAQNDGSPNILMSGQPEVDSSRRLRMMDTIRPDIHVVYPMVIPLGKLTKNPLPLINEGRQDPKGVGVEMFGCKHLSESGDCTIYDARPLMCRQYALHKNCEYQDCTWEGHQEKKREPLKEIHLEKIPEPPDDPLDYKLTEKALSRKAVTTTGYIKE